MRKRKIIPSVVLSFEVRSSAVLGRGSLPMRKLRRQQKSMAPNGGLGSSLESKIYSGGGRSPRLSDNFCVNLILFFPLMSSGVAGLSRFFFVSGGVAVAGLV